MAIHFTEKEYQEFLGQKVSARVENKYHNKKVELDGIKFDSAFERDCYAELKLRERAGEIKDLKVQPVFELVPAIRENGRTVQRAVTYRADFSYIENGSLVVCDAKGYCTQVYRIKKKLMKARGIEITELRREK